jgi:hypothetical protein
LSVAGEEAAFDPSSPRDCCVGAADRQVCWTINPHRGGRPYRILFHSNQLGFRGTEIGLFEYARFFEELACGESYIATNDGATILDTLPKFESRFGPVHFVATPIRRVPPKPGRVSGAVGPAAARAAIKLAAARRKAARKAAEAGGDLMPGIPGSTTGGPPPVFPPMPPGGQPRRLLEGVEDGGGGGGALPEPPPLTRYSAAAAARYRPTLGRPSPSSLPGPFPFPVKYDPLRPVLANVTLTLEIDAIFTIQPDVTAPEFIRPSALNPNVRLLTQGVFYGTGDPAIIGARMAVVGDAVPRKAGIKVVPRIVNFDPLPADAKEETLRAELRLPPTTERVFCRHGDGGTFSIGFVRDTVCRHARLHPNDVFLFLNTNALNCSRGASRGGGGGGGGADAARRNKWSPAIEGSMPPRGAPAGPYRGPPAGGPLYGVGAVGAGEVQGDPAKEDAVADTETDTDTETETDPAPPPAGPEPTNIIYLPASFDLAFKRRFLASCDAFLHARSDGETFGMAVAEASLMGLPVLTYGKHKGIVGQDNHLRILGEHALIYNTTAQLERLLQDFDVEGARAKAPTYAGLYERFRPAPVMLDFLANFGILGDVIAAGVGDAP